MKILVSLIALVSLASCKSRIDSDLKISGGIADFNQPFIVPLFDIYGRKFCSATMVADNIAISAAHCFIPGRTAVVVTSEFVRASSKIIVPMQYVDFKKSEVLNEVPTLVEGDDSLAKPNESQFQYDVAVIYFDDQIKTKFIGVETKERLKANDKGLKILGYGCNRVIQSHIPRDSILEKAYELGLISWISPDELTISRLEIPNLDVANSYVAKGVLRPDEGSSYDVAVCPGDSGGALLKGAKLVGVTSRVDDEKSESLFTSLQHEKVSEFVTRSLSGDLKSDGIYEVVTPELEKDFQKSESFKSSVTKIREQLEYIKRNKTAISNELMALYKNLKPILLKQKADQERVNKVLEERKQTGLYVLKKMEVLQKKYPNDGLMVLPSILNHEKPLFKLGQTIGVLRDFRDVATGIEVSKEFPGGRRFTSLEFMNNYFFGIENMEKLNDRDQAPIVQPAFQLAPPNPMDKIGRIILFESDSGDLVPVIDDGLQQPRILDDIHIADTNLVTRNLAKFINSKGWQNRALVVPHFTLRPHPNLSTFLEIIKANAIVIRNGRILEVLPLK